MKLKFFILITFINSFMFHEYKDTDCYQEAGHSAQECKKFTTFVDNDPAKIEENVLYLCCYVNNSDYQGCLPIKEDVVFAENKEFSFDCNSSFNKIQIFFILLCFSSIF